MGLLSFFKRSPGATPGQPPADAQQAVAQARTTARRRLIGAVVLLGLGIIGFPLLFETQPRPIPVDIAIEIPRKDNAAPLAVPAPRPPAPAASKIAPVVITETQSDAGKVVVAPAEPPAPKVEPKAPLKAEPKPETKPEPKAQATPEPKPAAKVAAAAATVDGAGRFVVQVGAFADPAVARETRLKVEKLGLRTYTQLVQVEGGQRIRVRVGPFASRDEADKVAGKVKAAGLPSAVLTL